MTNLSEDFTLEELIYSPRAVKLGYKNDPNAQQVESLRKLVTKILQPTRTYFARPVLVDSGFRSPSLNRVVGGAYNSQHLNGEAADVRIQGIGNDIIWSWIRDNLEFDQIILEHVPAASPQSGWVHCSYGPRLRLDAISCPSVGHYVEGLVYATV